MHLGWSVSKGERERERPTTHIYPSWLVVDCTELSFLEHYFLRHFQGVSVVFRPHFWWKRLNIWDRDGLSNPEFAQGRKRCTTGNLFWGTENLFVYRGAGEWNWAWMRTWNSQLTMQNDVLDISLLHSDCFVVLLVGIKRLVLREVRSWAPS